MTRNIKLETLEDEYHILYREYKECNCEWVNLPHESKCEDLKYKMDSVLDEIDLMLSKQKT